jgi:hypothetical protein
MLDPALKPRERLTFGVELEMAIAGLHPGIPDPSPNDSQSVHGLLDTARSVIGGDDNAFEVLCHILKLSPHWKPQGMSAWVATFDLAFEDLTSLSIRPPSLLL